MEVTRSRIANSGIFVVYEPKHVARNTTNSSNKLRVVYDFIILQFYTTYIDHIKHKGDASLENWPLSFLSVLRRVLIPNVRLWRQH